MPLPTLKDLSIFKTQIAKMNLLELMQIECTNDNLLLYGRYVKLSREIS